MIRSHHYGAQNTVVKPHNIDATLTKLQSQNESEVGAAKVELLENGKHRDRATGGFIERVD